MEADCIVTDHAYLRGKERLGLSKGAMKRTAEKARASGTPRTEYTGGFRRYLDKLYFSHDGNGDLLIFGHHIYVFKGAFLLTVLEVPRNYIKTAVKGKKP